MESTIPIVNLSALSSGVAEKREEALRGFTDACHKLGFVYIVDHGITPEHLQEAFDWSQKLFALDHNDKMKAPHPAGPIPHRGYSHPGLEKVYSKEELVRDERGEDLRKISDFKESFEIGSEKNNPPHPNIWLPEEVLPGFRAFMTDFYWELNQVARVVLQAIGESLSLTSDEMDDLFKLHSGHNNQLRLLHYPPVPAEQLESRIVARMPAHADWSSFTMLFQDDCGGLELEDPNNRGTFIPATPVPGALVLNIGDMFQRFSNDALQSAMHRVTLPPLQTRQNGVEHITRSRYSIPYFVAPDDRAVVKCFPSLVKESQPAKYEPVAHGDYGAWIAKHSYRKAAVTA